MSEELGQKSEELRKYHAEQSVAFSRIRELVGNPAEIVNKAHLYDPDDRNRRSSFRQVDSPHPSQVLQDDEGPSGGNPEGSPTRRDPQASALPGCSKLANRDHV